MCQSSNFTYFLCTCCYLLLNTACSSCSFRIIFRFADRKLNFYNNILAFVGISISNAAFGYRYLNLYNTVTVFVKIVTVNYYLRRRLASLGIVSLGVTVSRVCVSVCPPTARRISLGGDGNALYPLLSSFICLVPKMIYYVSRGTLNSAHSLTHCAVPCIVYGPAVPAIAGIWTLAFWSRSAQRSTL